MLIGFVPLSYTAIIANNMIKILVIYDIYHKKAELVKLRFPT